MSCDNATPPIAILGIVWALYNLAKYPDHQEKCRQEVDELFDQKDVLELWVEPVGVVTNSLHSLNVQG